MRVDVKKFLAYYQIIGGGIGVIMALLALLNSPINIALIIGLFLFIISVVAGMNLLKEGNKIGSYVNFSLQAIYFSFFQYYTVAALTMSFTSNLNVGLDFEIASNFHLNIEDDSAFLVGINIIPVILLVQLFRLKPEEETEPKSPINSEGPQVPIDSDFLKRE